MKKDITREQKLEVIPILQLEVIPILEDINSKVIPLKVYRIDFTNAALPKMVVDS